MKNTNKKPTAIDLFSGCGGLTLGLKQAGFKVIGAVEIDSVAAETYGVNHSEVNMWQNDIRELSGAEILSKLKLKKGELDLLAGCPPCQGFSSMRTHNGKEVKDLRNDLVFDYLRLVKELCPKAVMLENVPALAENKRMKVFKKELEDMGYESNGTPLVLNTANYGVPQRRRRMILVSSRIGKIDLPAGTSNKKTTVKDAIGGMPLPGGTGDPLHDIKENRTKKVIEMIRLIPRDGGSRTDLPRRLHLECHKKISSGFRDVYGRMSWDDVSPTITGGCISPSKGRFLHPVQNRAITLREAALLQTFPKDYFFSLKRGRQGVALMIGNALPPEFIRQHAASIKKSIVASKL
jgi:DNA (cytosine-5)-methyltransferase 1